MSFFEIGFFCTAVLWLYNLFTIEDIPRNSPPSRSTRTIKEDESNTSAQPEVVLGGAWLKLAWICRKGFQEEVSK